MENKQYFFGYEVSDYGQERGYVDYCTLAKAVGDAILCNEIVEAEELEPWCGTDYIEEEDRYVEVFQFYLITERGARLLADFTDEIVYYCPKLDLYVWGITHYGTSWDYVLTDIKLSELKELYK